MIRSLFRLLTVPDKLAMLGLVRGMGGQVQLGTASALLRSGVLRHLDAPRTLDELCVQSGIGERELLRHLLELGVRRRLLRRNGDAYAPRSRFAKCLARDPEGPLASMLAEATTYHQEVFGRLPERMAGEPPRDYLARYGALVAQSSRIMAPWIRAFMAEVLAGEERRSILELGCGAGAFLAFYAELHPEHQGVGLDFDSAVVAGAAQGLADAGLGDRFSVRMGDMRAAGDWPEGPFDVVTAHQNAYYFDAAERAELWRRCREHLTDSGSLAIVTPTSGGPMSDYFSLLLLSTAGCRPLPSIDALTSELQEAGFALTRRERLIPGDAVWGLVARPTLHPGATK